MNNEISISKIAEITDKKSTKSYLKLEMIYTMQVI